MRSALARHAALVGAGLVAFACDTSPPMNLRHTVDADDVLRVRYGDIVRSEVRGRRLSGTRVESLGDDRLVGIEFRVWNDADGDRLRGPDEAQSPPTVIEADFDQPTGTNASFFEWTGLRLPPGNDLWASVEARFERGDAVTLTWALFPDAPALE